jgi:hypothetical protein
VPHSGLPHEIVPTVPTAFTEHFRGSLRSLRHPVPAVALGMIALQLVYRSWALYSGYFYTDDYLLLRDAQRDGLTSHYLLAAYNSHLMPGSRALVWLVESSGPLNWGLAATVTLVVQAVASLAALWMLVGLFGRRWAVLAPLALYLTSAMTAQATLWWISSLNQISIQAAFFLAVGAWVGYLRTRRLGWLLAAGGSVALGLLFFQKILLVLPVLVFVAFVYFAPGGPRERLGRLVRNYWLALLVMGGVAGTYAVYSLLEVRQPFTGSRPTDVPQLMWNMVGTAVVGALGGPWRWEWHPGGSWAATPTWLVISAVVAAALLAAYSVLQRVRAYWAWVLLIGYLAMEVLLVATSRAPVLGAEIGLAYRLQTDVICAVVLCTGLAFLPLVGAAQSSQRRDGVRGPAFVAGPVPVPVVAGAVVLVSVSGLVCWSTYAATWHEHNTSEAYLRTLDRELLNQGTTDLVDSEVPEDVLPAAFFAPDNKVSTLVGLLDRDVAFPRSGSRLAVVSSDGDLHEALVSPSRSAPPGPHPNCGWLVEPPRLKIPLPGRPSDFDSWVRLGYLSNSADSVLVTLGDQRVRSRVVKGLSNLYVRASGEFDSVVVSGMARDTKLCVDVVQGGPMMEGQGL